MEPVNLALANWETVRAENFCAFVTDGTHDSPKAQKQGHKLITSKHLKEYYIDFESANWISESDYQKVISRSGVEQWDILYSMIGTVGNCYLERNAKIDYACKNMGIFKFPVTIQSWDRKVTNQKNAKSLQKIHTHSANV